MSERDDDDLLARRLRAHLGRIAAQPVPAGLEARAMRRQVSPAHSRSRRFAGAMTVTLVTAALLTVIVTVGMRSRQAANPSDGPPLGALSGSSSSSPRSSAMAEPSLTPAPVAQGTPRVPAARSGAALAYDGVGHRVLMFGDAAMADAGTYAWTPAGWRALSPAVSPPARANPAMAWDPADHVVLLFGSQVEPGVPGQTDTWAWDGATWRKLVTATGPGLTDFPKLAWDQALGQLVLTGVYSNYPTAPGTDPARAETWVWKSGNWVLADYLTTPHSGQPQTAYDPVGKRVVMVVFSDPTGPANNLTDVMYGWSGSRWARISAQVPATLWSMATDYGRGRVVGVRADGSTYVWDGSTWTAAHPGVDDNASAGVAFAWDPDVDAVVEYGVLLNRVVNGIRLGTDTPSPHLFLWTGQEWQPQRD